MRRQITLHILHRRIFRSSSRQTVNSSRCMYSGGRTCCPWRRTPMAVACSSLRKAAFAGSPACRHPSLFLAIPLATWGCSRRPTGSRSRARPHGARCESCRRRRRRRCALVSRPARARAHAHAQGPPAEREGGPSQSAPSRITAPPPAPPRPQPLPPAAHFSWAERARASCGLFTAPLPLQGVAS